MANNTIIADPSRLVAVDDKVKNSTAKIKSAFAELTNINKGTEAVWTGDAAELYRSLYIEQLPKMEDVIRSLSSQADKLNQIAANYRSVEGAGARSANALPNDVLI